MTLKNKLQSGRSMIEMLGVLAIVGILSAGGIAGYSMAMENHKTNVLIEKIQITAQRIQELYNGEYPLNISSSTILKDAGFAPDQNSPFGGSITFRTMTGGKTFRIYLTGIPTNACVKLITTFWGDYGVFEGIGTGRSYDAAEFMYYKNTYPADRAAAISVCKGGNKDMALFFK